MSRYGRRVVLASIVLHIIGLIVYFIYWLNTDPISEKDLQQQTAATSNTLAEGEKNEAGGEDEIPDTGRNPLEDYADGDLADKKIASLITNAQNRNENLSTKEKVENLNTELKGISRTPVKEVEKMTNLAQRAFGIKKETSKKPIREPKLGETLDPESTSLWDYEIVDDKYVLIFKDKNNLIIKGNPTEYDEFDPDMKVRLTLMKKAKENKKFKMLLDTTNSIIDKLNPPKKSNSESSN